jgi:hypothetical protein
MDPKAQAREQQLCLRGIAHDLRPAHLRMFGAQACRLVVAMLITEDLGEAGQHHAQTGRALDSAADGDRLAGGRLSRVEIADLGQHFSPVAEHQDVRVVRRRGVDGRPARQRGDRVVQRLDGAMKISGLLKIAGAQAQPPAPGRRGRPTTQRRARRRRRSAGPRRAGRLG